MPLAVPQEVGDLQLAGDVVDIGGEARAGRTVEQQDANARHKEKQEDAPIGRRGQTSGVRDCRPQALSRGSQHAATNPLSKA